MLKLLNLCHLTGTRGREWKTAQTVLGYHQVLQKRDEEVHGLVGLKSSTTNCARSWVALSAPAYGAVVNRHWKDHVKFSFFAMFPAKFWTFLVNLVNSNFNVQITTKNISADAKHHYRQVSYAEMFQFWGIWILLLLEYSQLDSSMKENFKKLKNNNKFKFNMGLNRFFAIHRCLSLSSVEKWVLSFIICWRGG